jgi:hypothetical protein
MLRPAQILFAAFAALFVSASAMAAVGGITIGLNETRRIMLPGSAATVVVGDPKIADVSMVDSHSVILMGRGYGATQLLITDHDGRTLLESEVMVPESGHVTLYRGNQAYEYGCADATCRLQEHLAGPAAVAAPAPPVASAEQDTPISTSQRQAMSSAPMH